MSVRGVAVSVRGVAVLVRGVAVLVRGVAVLVRGAMQSVRGVTESERPARVRTEERLVVSDGAMRGGWRRQGSLAVAALLIVACAAACGVYWLVPYAPGRWTQTWTVTVTGGGRTASSTGLGIGRCGDEGPHGAAAAKAGALGRACFAARLCPGDAVCDCAATATVRTRCEPLQTPGPTRLGERITVPVR